jgi:hypothetical protein
MCSRYTIPLFSPLRTNVNIPHSGDRTRTCNLRIMIPPRLPIAPPRQGVVSFFTLGGRIRTCTFLVPNQGGCLIALRPVVYAVMSAERLELPTSWFEARRSIRLSYAPA